MNPVKDPNELAPILHQAKNDLQVVLAGVDKLAGLMDQLQELTAQDPVMRDRVRTMGISFEKINRLLEDVLSDLRGLRSPEAINSVPAEAVPRSSNNNRILVIDDERPVVELVDRVLKGQGYQVDAVYNGQSAIDRVAQQFYDLIIADLKMPDIGGMDVYHHIAHHHPEQARRVVFISGDIMSPHTMAFLERTGVPYLVKPFTIRELTSFVEKALE